MISNNHRTLCELKKHGIRDHTSKTRFHVGTILYYWLLIKLLNHFKVFNEKISLLYFMICFQKYLLIKLNGSCLIGYTGRDCDVALRLCDEHECQNHALCLIEDQMSVCYCVPDYHGKLCQYQYDECQLGIR